MVGFELQAIGHPIVALVFGTVVAALLQLPVETIGTKFGGIPQSLPSFAFPELSLDTIRHLIGPAIAIALLGAIESLLSATVADNMIDDRHNPNQELIAQGLANIVAPLFGGFCATGAIARTNTNVRMGAYGPLAGIVHAATLLAVILVAAPLAVHVPLAALSAILVVVAWSMGEWSDFREMRRYTMNYRSILLATFVLTVVFDLTVAVQAGMVLAAVLFITRISSLTDVVDDGTDTMAGDRVCSYELFGSLFFGSANKLEPLLAHAEPADPCRAIVLDMQKTIKKAPAVQTRPAVASGPAATSPAACPVASPESAGKSSQRLGRLDAVMQEYVDRAASPESRASSRAAASWCISARTGRWTSRRTCPCART